MQKEESTVKMIYNPEADRAWQFAKAISLLPEGAQREVYGFLAAHINMAARENDPTPPNRPTAPAAQRVAAQYGKRNGNIAA